MRALPPNLGNAGVISRQPGKGLDLRLPQTHAHRKCEAEDEYALSRWVARLNYHSSFSKGMRWL